MNNNVLDLSKYKKIRDNISEQHTNWPYENSYGGKNRYKNNTIISILDKANDFSVFLLDDIHIQTLGVETESFICDCENGVYCSSGKEYNEIDNRYINTKLL